MTESSLTREEEMQLKKALLMAVLRRLAPQCPEDRALISEEILPKLIEILLNY